MIRQATRQDAGAAAALALQLWPENDLPALTAEMEEIIQDGAVFLAEEGGAAIGFAQCQLRHDYVEGTETSPVGYLEGVYVQAAHRRRGVARALLAACEQWARAQGCREFASDCELTNAESLLFHLNMGFIEANRIICFTKDI